MTGFNGVGPLLPHSYTIGTDYVPKNCIVIDVTNALNAIVTTAIDHGFQTDWIVQILVPFEYGMRIPQLDTKITVLSPTTFSCTLDTSQLLPFVTPSNLTSFTLAQVIPISGDTVNAIRSDGTF